MPTVNTLALTAPPSRQAADCLTVNGVCAWTGRSAMSLATDSALSRLVTAGTFRTRVSEMRLVAGTDALRAQREHVGSDVLTVAHGILEAPHLHHWSG